ncbi:hypothetical protein [Nostoc sp. FACHB-110]|nr:hypothetical protein [Nostoc sp. FACHB-110]
MNLGDSPGNNGSLFADTNHLLAQKLWSTGLNRLPYSLGYLKLWCR